jgi:hypothetical protein
MHRHRSWLPLTTVQSLDYLLERDKQREQDGFPRKIRVGKMVKPSQDGDDKVVIVPTTVEEKLLHDQVRVGEEGDGGGEGGGEGGAGEGDEGEVIGEQPVRPEKGAGQGGAGQGDGSGHDIESNAYDLGRILTEQFELPNLKDKGKKRSLTKYTYDLTDKNRGFGQILDKKATLKRIIETNIALQRVKSEEQIDSRKLLISPDDRVYRILSKEKDYESQAVVFFVRDYSGSMGGKPTELVVNQHVLIYSWLIYQYKNQVITRFILHDTEAKEVKNFQTYYNPCCRRHSGVERLSAGQQDRRGGEPRPRQQHLCLSRHRRRRLGHQGREGHSRAAQDARLRQSGRGDHRRKRLRHVRADRGGEVSASLRHTRGVQCSASSRCHLQGHQRVAIDQGYSRAYLIGVVATTPLARRFHYL